VIEEDVMAELICPVCRRTVTVPEQHGQKMPDHHDNKGQPCRGAGRKPT
jgi:hypothetical protein